MTASSQRFAPRRSMAMQRQHTTHLRRMRPPRLPGDHLIPRLSISDGPAALAPDVRISVPTVGVAIVSTGSSAQRRSTDSGRGSPPHSSRAMPPCLTREPRVRLLSGVIALSCAVARLGAVSCDDYSPHRSYRLVPSSPLRASPRETDAVLVVPNARWCRRDGSTVA